MKIIEPKVELWRQEDAKDPYYRAAYSIPKRKR